MAISITQFMPIFASNPLDGQLGTQQDHRGLGSSALQAAVGDLFHPRLYSLFGGGGGGNLQSNTGGVLPVPSGPTPEDANEAGAIRRLLNNRSLITNSNGAIGNVELQAAANGILPGMSNLSPEQQAELKSSAKYYLDHDDGFKQMETIQGAPADGACNVDDLRLRMGALVA